ncbi:UNVERIFIED_CONTAM: hypothetical protein GTU68_026402 [Idotea baltica]|nr:hypothetical protein [Idotea baltica]
MKRNVVLKGLVYISCTNNNIIISITDKLGNILGWTTAGHQGFKGSKKSSPFAAQIVVEKLYDAINKKNELKNIDIFINGFGSSRESALKAFFFTKFSVLSITDTTSLPHNGCRARKKRRV